MLLIYKDGNCPARGKLNWVEIWCNADGPQPINVLFVIDQQAYHYWHYDISYHTLPGSENIAIWLWNMGIMLLSQTNPTSLYMCRRLLMIPGGDNVFHKIN